MASTTLNFNSVYNKGYPDFPGADYGKNYNFQTQTTTLKLNSQDIKEHSFTFTIPSGLPRKSLVIVHFSAPNKSIISVRNNGDNIYYTPQYDKMPISFSLTENSDNLTLKVITNGDPDLKTNYLNISVAIGLKRKDSLTSKSVSISYTCNTQTLYSYESGIHVYSPYDSRDGNSTLRTKIYSFTPINSWTTDTILYSTPYASAPAYPYWYGIGGNVYRVGSEWSRSRGTKTRLEVRKKYLQLKPKSKVYEDGPLETFDSTTQTSETCIEPVFRDTGKIKKISSTSSLSAPQKYRYYLGYDNTNQRESNDNFFQAISYAKNETFPITGFQHAQNKLPKGLIRSTTTDHTGRTVAGFIIAMFLMLGFQYSLIGRGAGKIVTSLLNTRDLRWFLSKATNNLHKKLFGTSAKHSGWAFVNSGVGKALIVAWKVIVVAAVVALVIFLFLNLFKRYTVTYAEKCSLFLHHFSTTPYLNVGNSLYRDEALTDINTGYYCDGAYYYTLVGSSITQKVLSSTNAFTNDDPFTQEFLYSVAPDDESLVTDQLKLIMLPYISGKPLPYYGGSQIYYSEEFEETFSGIGGDLENPIVKTVKIPASASTSNVSVAAANNEAKQEFSASLEVVRNNLEISYGVKIDDSFIGELEAQFTHELKHENTPTNTLLYYDNRSGSLTTGTPVYYDPQGHQKALSGYYAADTASPYYKVFYKVDKGYIVDIDYSVDATATSSVNGNPMTTTNLDYTSNWYLLGYDESSLQNHAGIVLSEYSFEPNTLYSSSLYELVAGFEKSSSLEDFRVFEYNTSSGVVNTSSAQIIEAESGWYLRLNDWLDVENTFEYQDTLVEFTSSTRGSSPSEVCPFTVNHLSQSFYHNGNTGSLPQEGNRIYTSTGSLLNLRNVKLQSGYYMIASSSIMVVDGDGVVNNIRTCTDAESEIGNNVSPVLLRYNTSTNTNYACTSSQATFYISGSFTGTLHGIWANSTGTIRANSGSYSNGTVYRSYVKGIGDTWFVSNTQSCSSGGGGTVLSSSLLSFASTEAGACGGFTNVRYWYVGSDWYNSSDLYQSTSSNGQGQTQASNGWYSDGITVNQYTNSSWGSAGICGF